MPAVAVECPFEVRPILHPRGCRSYVVVDPESREALVVDPLLDRVEETERVVAAAGARLRWIVDTHSHGDHLSGAAALRARTGAEVVMSQATASKGVTRRMGEGDLLTLGENVLRVRAAPGNSPDGIVLEAKGALFTGDTLLVGTVGARDVPGWDAVAHYETLQRIVEPLHDSTAVYPGHDDMGREKTTLKAERRGNKWLRERDRDTFVARLNADPRPPAPEAEEILAANLAAVDRVPEGLTPPTAPVLDTPAARMASATPVTGLVPEGLSHLLLAGGVLAVVGTLLGFLLHPFFHLLAGVAGAVAVGVGLSGKRPAKKKAGPGLYYTGPVPRTPGRRYG
jgi:glyoxylase-like metal-dependent hydrolase (beta-lactamase superfamily II)